MRVGRKVNPLLLGLFVCLSIVALSAVTPAHARGTGSPYSCSVGITVASGNFYVKTTVSAATGYTLPGPTEKDNVNTYRNGVLYNTQTSIYAVAANTMMTTVIIPVPTNGSGSYSFQSSILNSKGSQLTSCSGTYSL